MMTQNNHEEGRRAGPKTLPATMVTRPCRQNRDIRQDRSARLRRAVGPALLVLTVIVSWCSTAPAVSIHPDVRQKLIEEGRWEETVALLRAARAAGMDAGTARDMRPLAAGAQGTEFASRIPCILVEFTDNLWASRVNTSKGRIDTMLFSDGFKLATGSMRDYYLENSYGLFDIEGEVVGPVMMPQTYAYYIRDSAGIQLSEPNSRTLVHDAVIAADSLIDFSQFDANTDSLVDGVMVICAGYGYEESGDPGKIQSHHWGLPIPPALGADGKIIRDYAIQPEEHGPFVGAETNGIGVICHEWGHVLQLIDLYDEDYTSFGVGNWSLMGSGNYLDLSRTPAHLDPWSKSRLGWVTVETVGANRVNQSIPAFETSPTVFRLWIPGIAGNEYFLLCNRRKTGFDAKLPGSGLMILHIDELKPNNEREYIPGQGWPSANHYKVAVVQADGLYHLEDSINVGDANDLYTNATREFDDLTNPSSRSYSGFKTQVAVWNISAPGATMTANLDVTFSRPLLQLASHSFMELSGDGDFVPDPGETVQLFLTTHNLWKATSGIQISVSCSSPNVSFSSNTSYIDELGMDLYSQNSLDPIQFSVIAGTQPTIADFYVNYQCEGGVFTFAETLRVDLGPKQVLLVDGDADYMGGNYRIYYSDALERLRVPYAVHDRKTQGAPSAALLQQYPMALWWTGKHREGTIAAGDSVITHADVVAVQTYLNNGGRLFMTGQDIAERLAASVDSLFLINYLGARYRGSADNPVAISGILGNPIGENLTLVVQGTGGAANQSHPDSLKPVPGASVSYRYSLMTWPPDDDGGIAAVNFASGNFKTVFWGFGLEAVTEIGLGVPLPPYDVTREQALSRVLYWLVNLQTGILGEDEYAEEETGGSGVPSRFTLFQNYPNPFNGRTTIEFAVADGGPAAATIEIFDILGRRVTTLFEGTVGPGMQQVAWEGIDRHGREVASGVYFYRLSATDGHVESRRMVYLK